MGYQPMDDWRGFLQKQPRPGVLATTRPDGSPHAAPVWFDLDGDTIVFTTGTDTVKGRNLRHDPRAVLCVQDDQPPFSFATVEARAARLGGRYMGAARADEYGARNGVPGELLVRLTPTRVVAKEDVAD